MPRKSRSKKAEVRELTRTALLREYRISDKTLRRLTETVLNLPVKSGRGRVLYVVDDAADVLLTMARNCPDSFAPFRPPFLRYIMLGFLTMPNQDILDGLSDRHIENRAVTLGYLKGAREEFLLNLPPALRDIVADYEEPSPQEEVLYEELLRILGVRLLYDHPHYMDEFYFSSEDLLHFINQVVWAQSCSDQDRAGAINAAAGYEAVSGSGLVWYRRAFHDDDFMRAQDLACYFGGLLPSARRAYRESRLITVEDLAIRSDLACNSVNEYQFASRHLKSESRRLMASSEVGAKAEAARMLTTALKIDDYLGKLSPADTTGEPPEHIRKITPAQYNYGDKFKVPPQFQSRGSDESEADAG